MSLKLSAWVFGGVAFLLALLAVTWRRDGGLPVHATVAVDATESPISPPSARYVGAYTVPLTTDSNAIANGSDRVGQVLGASASSAEKAQSLLTLFPQLPAGAQPAAARHIVNLLPDIAYASFAAQLTNASASAEVQAVIYADLLQRPNGIKLPWLLALARTPGISQSGAAAGLLQATLRADYGANWEAWSERIDAWLEAHPDAAELNTSN